MDPIENTDRIEKKVTLRAPRSRVWRAIASAEEFGLWFGMKLEGGFEAGKAIFGKITHPGYEHLKVEMQIDRIEPERYFVYRWHPYAIDPNVDYSSEPMTLVEFRLDEEKGNTILTMTESGFEKIPLARRAVAFRMNSGGWDQQAINIERHVSKP